jgi:alcohol dehydrogenase class IV
MSKLPLAYPSCRQPALVSSGMGAVRAVADGARVRRTVYFLSGSPRVRAAVAEAFRKRGVELAPADVIVKPEGEPDERMVAAGAAFLASCRYGRIAAIGGGSVMDWARLSWARTAGLLSMPGGRVSGDASVVARPELWLVPTTCATGAEAASVAVFSSGGRKVPVVSPAFTADHVLLDPQFLAWLPPRELACFLCDALSHAVEAYVSIVPSGLAKHSAVAALRAILADWSPAPAPERHLRLLEASYLGGVAASNCSVGVVHAFAHTMAAYGVPHAAANAAGLLPGLTANAAAPAPARLAAECGAATVEGLADRLRPLVQEALLAPAAAAIPHVLEDAGRRRDIAERMAGDPCLRSNPVALDAADLQSFVERAAQQFA